MASRTLRRQAEETLWGVLVSALAHVALLILVAGFLHRVPEVEPLDEPLSVMLWDAESRAKPDPPPEPVVSQSPPVADDPDRRMPAELDPPAEITPPTAPAPEAVDAVSAPDPLAALPPPDERMDPIPPAVSATPELADAVVPAGPPEPVAPSPVIPDPPDEIATPPLPVSLPDAVAADEGLVPPTTGSLPLPTTGPDADERARLLAERFAQASGATDDRAASLAGARPGHAASLPGPVRRPRGSGARDPRDDRPGPIRVAADEGVVGPLGARGLLYHEKPPYPAWARQLGLEAEVRFRIWVDPAGMVTRIDILSHSGSGELDDIARDTLRRWRFSPLPADAPDEDEWGVVPMSFTLIAQGD